MIEIDRRQQALRCTVCGELDGVSGRAANTPAILEPLKARMAREHAVCEQYQDNPRRAQVERQYARTMAAALRTGGL